MSNYQRPPATRSARPPQDNLLYYQQEPPRRPGRPAPGGGHGRGPARTRGNGNGGAVFPVWTVPVIATCALLIALMAGRIYNDYTYYSRFQALRHQVNQNTFFPGTTVDGVDLAGKTLDEAAALVQGRLSQQSEQFALTIRAGDKKWLITSQELPVGADTARVLRRAFAAGRAGNLQQRYQAVQQIATAGLDLSAEWGYDRAKLRQLTDAVADALEQPAQDARLTAFDPNAKQFRFAQEQNGQVADREKLYDDVTALLDNRQYNAEVMVTLGSQAPRVRQADLAPLYGLVASYSTETTTDKNRNNNISLSAQAINGKMLMPGEKLSFNDCTGQRTQAKGYLEAGAIQGGQLVDETGGGVCQTSSTLFNAVVRADLEIITRNQHSWPSTYVPRGEDAAVDFPRLDFVFRNNQETPVFVVAWYENQRITVEIYGRLMPAGHTIELFSETLKTYKPSEEVIYTRDPSLPFDTNKVAKQRRTGYLVETYKVYLQDGAEVERVKLWRTEYKAVQKEIYFN